MTELKKDLKAECSLQGMEIPIEKVHEQYCGDCSKKYTKECPLERY